MKKVLTIMCSLILIYSMTLSSFAAETENDLLKVSETYNLPINVLEQLDVEKQQELIWSVKNETLLSTSETYVKVTTDTEGNVVMRKSSYDEYVKESKTRAGNPDETSGWMRFWITISEVNSTTGKATCTFTWLTAPTPKLRDVVGIALNKGTVIGSSTSGFYYHSSPNDSYTYNFTSSDIRESGAGATAKFKLRVSDYSSGTTDYAYIQTRFVKEGASEGVTGTYAHQKISLAINPSFDIDRTGKITWTGTLSMISYYVQETGYDSIAW